MNLTIKAYAKINLFLDITGRLPNGYHTLNTVMQQINLYDNVTVKRTESEINVKCDNPAVPCYEKNIAYRAAAKFFAETGITDGASIEIEKKIPLEAGLGGSSTDGAAVLSALNELYGKPITDEKLIEIGAVLGADVPFCLTGGTAVCNGIGEKIRKVPCKKDYTLLIVKPDFSCSTALAYGQYDRAPIQPREGFEKLIEQLENGCESWCDGVYNVFEQLYRDPKIYAITEQLKSLGALSAALSGSGSAVFGVFKNSGSAENAQKNINLPFSRVIKG